jgi:hypothetical protein
MSCIFRASTTDDQPQIIELLTRVFMVGREAPFVDPALIQWKYWEPRADWPDARSFVLEKSGRMVAHAGLWPVALQTDGRPERGVHMIDWAADPQSPGAGASLLRGLTKRYDFVYSIGGSEMTQTILPSFGFRAVAEALMLVRPLRPWRQILRHQSRDARLPLRLLRNVWWSRVPPRVPARGWAATQVTADEWEGTISATSTRGGHFFRYLERCPPVRLLGFSILHEGRKVGLFLLSVAGEQTRLAGVLLERPSLESWRMAFRLAQDAALRFTATSELVARTSGELAIAAAREEGMRVRVKIPVFLYRKGDSWRTPSLDFQMWDNDSVFLEGVRPEFLS